MLPSWIRGIFKTHDFSEAIGLVIGGKSIACSHVVINRNAIKINEYKEEAINIPAFIGCATQDVVDSFNTALTKITEKGVYHDYIPFHVSLPDAALRMEVLEFDSVPKKQSEQRNLVNWRMQKETGSDNIVCSFQYLGIDGKKHLILALAIDKTWYEVFISLLQKNRVTAWSISADILRKFNRYHNDLDFGSGALVSLNHEYWSLLVWDNERRVRFLRSHWRSGLDDYKEIALEIERSIIAYVHKVEDRTVSRIYLISENQDSGFAEVINTRLSKPCSVLNMLMNVNFNQLLDKSNYIGGALSAALER